MAARAARNLAGLQYAATHARGATHRTGYTRPRALYGRDKSPIEVRPFGTGQNSASAASSSRARRASQNSILSNEEDRSRPVSSSTFRMR
jgi:hypothetical protein